MSERSNNLVWNWENLRFGRTAGKTLADGLDDGDLSRPEILAREITQNAIDATDIFRSEKFPDHSPRLVFRFRELAGQEKSEVVEILGLNEVAAHATRIKNRQSEVLSELEVLQDLDDLSVPLKVLIVEDYGARGLHGDKWAIALRGTGISDHDEDHFSGGTYGYGKGAFHIGSSLSLVAAFSRFQTEPGSEDTESVQHRFGAFLYQSPHNHPDTEERLTGFAECGQTTQDRVAKITEPFEGDIAVDIARRVGMSRDVEQGVNSLGTSFMMIDPVIGPEELSRALEDSWWPALVDGDISIDVVASDGQQYPPRPKLRDDLFPFIEAWGWLKGTSKPTGEFQRLRKLQKRQIQGESRSMGQIAVWADPDFAFQFAEDDDSRATQVALIRQRKMVVRYHPYFEGKAPYIQGILLTDADIEEFVSKIEPKLHNYWWQGINKVKDHWPETHKEVVKALAVANYNLIRDFRAALNPKVDQATVRLERLSKLLGNMFHFSSRTGVTGPAPAVFEPIAIGFPESSFTRKVSRNGSRVYGARLSLRLTEDFESDSAIVSARVKFSIVEDAGAKGPTVPTVYRKIPPGWKEVDGSLVGELSHENAEFEVETDEVAGPYEVIARAEALIQEELTG